MNRNINTEKEIKPALETNQLEAIAKQLRCPTGDEGIAMGEKLNETNKGMIMESIKHLKLVDRNRILELGHGSCQHLPKILEKAQELKYFGMEISEIMKEEAKRINAISIKNNQALFQLYNGIDISYVSNFFDRILTVNTIYFIENPLLFIEEMYRVLKPGGKFVLTFADGTFMEKLPFVVHSNEFSLFDAENIKALIDKTFFDIELIQKNKERIHSKTGELVDREYFIVELTKKSKKPPTIS